jgi:hypothetical protein
MGVLAGFLPLIAKIMTKQAKNFNPSSRPIIIGHFERSSASRKISPANSTANKNLSLRALSTAKCEKPKLV